MSKTAPRRSEVAGTRREALQLIHERLAERYGTPEQKPCRRPLEEVVFTILSQNTTDTNRDRAWAELWDRFDGWEGIAHARLSSISAAIEVGGLHRIKATRIRELLRQVQRERGSFDLDHLHELDMETARAELGRFKGLGAKSINCVLLFCLGLPAFPVDTHVHRVLCRLGVLETRDLARANHLVQADVPDGLAYPLHMNLIRHGRQVCKAQRPHCWDCPIEDLCGFQEKRFEQPA